MQIPSRITEFLLVLTEGRITLLLVKIALLILCTFMEMAPLLMITPPMLLPVINLSISLITPPSARSRSKGRLAPRFGLDTD